MKRNKLRVIQISGFRGILSALFVVACLIAGFVGFPAMMLTKGWNHIALSTLAIPEINIFQGLILWAILAISYLILNEKQKYLVAFEPKTKNPKEIRDIINEIKSHSSEFKKDVRIENNQQNPLETQEVKIAETNSTEQQNSEKETKEVV